MENLNREEILKLKELVTRIKNGDIKKTNETKSQRISRIFKNKEYYMSNHLFVNGKMYSYDREYIGDLFTVILKEVK